MVKAKKSLGQNFLTDPLILSQIIEAAELSSKDHILEVGPGKGALTEALLEQVEKLSAVELDDRLIPLLQAEFGQHPNFELIHADALTYTPPNTPYKVVANIPYYITSPLLNHFLYEQFTDGNPPQMLVLMVQKEVAEKIIAKKGKQSILSLQVHLFGTPEIVCIAPAKAFNPAPKVDSAVIKIRVHSEAKFQGDLKKLFWLFKVSFAQKRKKLSKNLSAIIPKKPAEIESMLSELGIDPGIRAEALTLEEWQKLYETVSKPA